MKRIKIEIDPLGNPKIEAEGFVGNACEQATAPIEKALAGGEGFTKELKPEWYQDQDQEEHEKVTW